MRGWLALPLPEGFGQRASIYQRPKIEPNTTGKKTKQKLKKTKKR